MATQHGKLGIPPIERPILPPRPLPKKPKKPKS